MEAKKKLRTLSLAALAVSLLPFLSLVPALLGITLPDGARTVWAACNIALALSGLLLSLACVKSRESRSLVHIMSAIISGALVLMIWGFAALVLFLRLTRQIT